MSIIKALFRNWDGRLFTGWNVMQSISWKVNGTIESKKKKKGWRRAAEQREMINSLQQSFTNQIDVFCSEGGNTKMDEILAIQLNIQNEETVRETDV